jgi:predicted RNA-binding protein
MCLAKVYVRDAADDSNGALVMENVTRAEVEGDQVRLVSLLGDRQELSGRITSIDFAEGRLVLQTGLF